MGSLPFTPSEACSLGVELELQLVNTRDYNLTTDAPDLLRRLRDTGGLKPEITQSMVEINSSVHQGVDTLTAELQALRDALAKEARRMNIAIAGGGSHPFQQWSERRIFPTERFLSVSEQYGYLAKQYTVFGQHIHIGCPSGDDALYLCHGLARYLPHFVALSASSPFYQGVDTAFDSSRLSVVNAFPMSGTLPWVHSWEEFEAYFDKMTGFGIVKSMKDFYWDVRPKPEFGTVEIRVCDTPLTVEKAADLAAYAQALARWLLDERPALDQDVYLIYSYNRFQSCRFGLCGRLVLPGETARPTIGEDIVATLRQVDRYASDSGGREALARLEEDTAKGENGASWLRRAFAETKTLSETVRRQSLLWMDKPENAGR